MSDAALSIWSSLRQRGQGIKPEAAALSTLPRRFWIPAFAGITQLTEESVPARRILESVTSRRYYRIISIALSRRNFMFSQFHSNAANALRFGAVGVCAAAVGRWRMSAMAQPHVVINNGKSRAHRAR